MSISTIVNAAIVAAKNAAQFDNETVMDAYNNGWVWDEVVGAMKSANRQLDEAIKQVEIALKTCGLDPEVDDFGQSELWDAKDELEQALIQFKLECREMSEWADSYYLW